MRIAHIVESMAVGGAETLVQQLCLRHSEMGHLLDVHCLFERGPLSKRLEAQGIEVHLHGPGTSAAMARSLHRALRSMMPDVVHCHSTTATKIGAISAALAGVRNVLTTRHSCGMYGTHAIRHQLLYWLAARFCSVVVAVSDAARDSIVAEHGAVPERVRTLYNGALPAIRKAAGTLPERRGFTIVNVARLIPAKDQDSLIQGVAQAARVVPDLRLWIIGDGPERERLQERARSLDVQERILFAGTRPDVGCWLESADVFVLSSVREGLPVSLLEAMAAGLPCIVTNVGGMPEVLAKSSAGVVVPPRNPHMFASAIAQMASARASLPELGRRARACYDAYFTLDRMSQEYLELYNHPLAQVAVPAWLVRVAEGGLLPALFARLVAPRSRWNSEAPAVRLSSASGQAHS